MIACLCGSTLAEVVDDSGGDTARAIVFRCSSCDHLISLQMRLRDMGRANPQSIRKAEPVVDPRCGTNQGHQAHMRRKERACEACDAAHKRHVAEWRQRRRVAA